MSLRTNAIEERQSGKGGRRETGVTLTPRETDVTLTPRETTSADRFLIRRTPEGAETAEAVSIKTGWKSDYLRARRSNKNIVFTLDLSGRNISVQNISNLEELKLDLRNIGHIFTKLIS